MLENYSLENMLLIVTQWDSGLPGRLSGRLYANISAICKELLRELRR